MNNMDQRFVALLVDKLMLHYYFCSILKIYQMLYVISVCA